MSTSSQIRFTTFTRRNIWSGTWKGEWSQLLKRKHNEYNENTGKEKEKVCRYDATKNEFCCISLTDNWDTFYSSPFQPILVF